MHPDITERMHHGNCHSDIQLRQVGRRSDSAACHVKNYVRFGCLDYAGEA
jgi:hypothetical protein